jgi:hypothetical protein
MYKREFSFASTIASKSKIKTTFIMTPNTSKNSTPIFPATFLVALILGSIISVSATAEEPQLEPPVLLNRALTGTIDFGSSGRQVTNSSLLRLGTLTLTSETFADEDLDMDGVVDNPIPSFSIDVSAGGYALLPNGLLIRSTSETDVQFNGANQSHTFDVYQTGAGRYEHHNTGLTGATSYTNGSGDVETAYGGNWFWEADYVTISGQTETVARTFELGPTQSSILSPLTLDLARSGNDIDERVNETTSRAPAIPRSLDLEGLSPLEFRLADDQTLTLERQNSLFSVPQVDGQSPATLSLNAAISGSGNVLANRRLTNSTVNLGRFIANQPPVSVSQTDTVTLRTRGTNEGTTQIQLNSFDLGNTEGPIAATFDGTQVFDGSDDTASVNLTANFQIDSTNGLGSQRVALDASNAIQSLENLPGESLSGLSLGYRYSVVENNTLRSDDITWFSFEGAESNFSPDLVAIGNDTIAFENSTITHTNLDVPLLNGRSLTLFPFDNNVHTRTLSEGNGVTGEGLPGENVIATTSFDIHRINIQGADLSATESGTYTESDSITFTNETEFDASQTQAEIFLVDDRTTGSTRWSLPGLNNLDLSAGGTLTVTPTFDDSGLSTEQLGGLGRRFRTSIELTFQNGVVGLNRLAVEGTSIGNVGSEGDGVLNVLGSTDSRQTRNYFFERSNDVQATTGTATLAFGSTLAGEGISLENTPENTSFIASTPTTFQVIDSDVLTSDSEAEVTFFSLDNLDGTTFADTDTTPLFTDIVEFTGLAGTQHVIELTFDAIAASVNRAEVLWLNDDNLWVNAVFGNSNIVLDSELSFDSPNTNLLVDGLSISISDYLDEQRFDGSYDQYLASLEEGQTPELGVFGSDNSSAWAIIDHNSAFALAASSAIPEPSPSVIFGILLAMQAASRRRQQSQFPHHGLA